MTLDDLIVLNEEIAALVRAGVPLEAGLAELGRDMPGRLGRFAVALAERNARGESLDQVLADEADELPLSYRAVVQAGARAGRLPAALEAVAASVRRLAETYLAVTVAAAYPMFVVVLAWFGLVLFVVGIAPRLDATVFSLGFTNHRFYSLPTWISDSVWIWGPLVPAVVVLAALGWRFTYRKAAMSRGHWTARLLEATPWLGDMLRCSRTAAFLEILALLIDNHEPFPEALILAAEASGDPSLLQSARQLASMIENGQMHPEEVPGTFPPLLRWLLTAAGRDGALLPALQHSAATYHRRARRQADLLRIFLPVFLTVVVAGGVTVLYALSFFAPYTAMLQALGG